MECFSFVKFPRKKNIWGSQYLSIKKRKHKILQKVAGWKAKTLSQAARTTLIQEVASTIPASLWIPDSIDCDSSARAILDASLCKEYLHKER